MFPLEHVKVEGEEKLGEEEHTYDGSDEDQTILYNSTV